MKYRQWKKNYKSEYGFNPPSERRQAKDIKKLLSAFPSAEQFKQMLARILADLFRVLSNVVNEINCLLEDFADGLAEYSKKD